MPQVDRTKIGEESRLTMVKGITRASMQENQTMLQANLCQNKCFETILSHDVASGSEITPCIKIDKPLVIYRFSGNVMTSITMLYIITKLLHFYARNETSK